MTTFPINAPTRLRDPSPSESTSSEGPTTRVFFSASTTDVEPAPSFIHQLTHVLHALREDPENRDLFFQDLTEAENPDAVEWTIEQWVETIEVERDDPDLVVDLLDRLRNRQA